MSKKKINNSFEEKLKRLEAIAEELEDSESGIENSIKLFEEGIKLSKECLTILEQAELKITELKNQLDKNQ